MTHQVIQCLSFSRPLPRAKKAQRIQVQKCAGEMSCLPNGAAPKITPMKNLLCVSLFLSALAFGKAPVNGSGISIKKGPIDLFKTGQKWAIDECRWKGAPQNILASTKLTSAELEKGTYCVSADFDGNGSLDFDIWGKLYSPGPGIAETRDHAIVLFEGNKVLRQKDISGRFRLLLYGPTKKKGRYGEPVTALPGLIDAGEGDATVIFLWDKAKKEFVHSEYASEDN
jgi:hypothetical protein